MKIVRLLVTLIVLVGLSYILHLLVYGVHYSLENASNALFVVGIITFLPAFIMHTGSFEVFDGMRYAFQSLFVRNFKKTYGSFTEYKKDHNSLLKTTFFMELMITSAIVLLVGVYLAYLVMRWVIEDEIIMLS